MRSTLIVLAMVAAAPLAAQPQDPGGSQADVVGSYRPDPYRALRPGELRSAAFLTEMRAMPYGQVLGPVAPPAVVFAQSPEMVLLGSTIAVRPPSGAAYQRGDTVVLAVTSPGPKGWGDLVLPTGLARIGTSTPRQTEAVVIALYGPVRAGQVTLPMSPTPKIGEAQPVKIDGPTGSFLFGREPSELHQQGSELFIDLGRTTGVRLGDYIEFRRRSTPRPGSADTVDEGLAVGQIVSLGEKSSTVRLFRIKDPSFPAGSPVLRIATLSN
jgi:hypothetical protein